MFINKYTIKKKFELCFRYIIRVQNRRKNIGILFELLSIFI